MSQAHLQPPVGPTDHVDGGPDAEVTLVEYGDFQCPYCGAAHSVLKRVRQRLGDRLRFVFRNFPISELHPFAEHAAEAAESVAAQAGARAFWAMHDLLFEHQHALQDENLARYAAKAGAKADVVLEDLADGRYTSTVRASFLNGARSGVNGTPTLFIDGIRYDGPGDEETLVAALTLVADNAGENAGNREEAAESARR